MGPSRRTHTDRPLAAALVVAVLYLGFLAAALARRDLDASFFVQAGDVFVNAAHAPAGLFILKNSAGYDGQFYYRLALTPFTDKGTDRGVRLDSPRYRQQRILYPLMARLLSVGATHLVPWALLAVNYVGVCAIGWLGGLFARSLGRHALWGTAFALYPGFLMTMSRDLPEIVEVGLVLAAVVGLRRGRPLLATTLLVLAVGAKETALLVAVGALLAWAVGMARERHQPPLWFGLLPAVGYGAWQTWLYFHWPEPLRLGVGTNIGAPFVAFVRFLRRTSAIADHLNAVWFAELVLLIAFVVLVGIAYRRSTVGFHLKLCWLLYVGLAVTLSRAVWVEDYAFLRALSEVYVLGVAILLGSKSRWTPAVTAGGLLCWALLAVDLVANR